MFQNPQWYEDIREKVLELDIELDKQLGKMNHNPDICPTCHQPIYDGPLLVRKTCWEGLAKLKGILFGMNPEIRKEIDALHKK